MKNDGGPAFPKTTGETQGGYGYVKSAGGMTLRDYFAGQALAGFLADSKVVDTPSEMARGAYKMADAMLAEREKEKT